MVMDRLYHYLSEGYDKAEALRRAKLDFLEQATGQAQFPAYWGGWMLVGDRTPIMRLSPEYQVKAFVLVTLVFLIIGGGLVIKQNRLRRSRACFV